MRLLNTATLKLHEFIGSQIPPYAILSHTWGEEEVSFQELQSGNSTEKKGFDKIRRCCEIAAGDGFEYAWVDTCCIDKTSSAELSEAINSMFRWYQRSEVCYAYLSDVPSGEDPQNAGSAFRWSRWFTRGWTLQELIAPVHLTFLGDDWTDIGSKLSLQDLVSGITKIHPGALTESGRLNRWSVAQKMSWASKRVTTREEDIAYCLMGIFDVNMPMLYGEGKKAFIRLQEEIIRNSEDETIFAWWSEYDTRENEEIYRHNRGLLASGPNRGLLDSGPHRGLLASGPHLFSRSTNVIQYRRAALLESGRSVSLVGNFIELKLPLLPLGGQATRKSDWDQYRTGLEYGNTKYLPGSYLAMLGCITFNTLDYNEQEVEC